MLVGTSSPQAYDFLHASSSGLHLNDSRFKARKRTIDAAIITRNARGGVSITEFIITYPFKLFTLFASSEPAYLYMLNMTPAITAITTTSITINVITIACANATTAHCSAT